MGRPGGWSRPCPEVRTRAGSGQVPRRRRAALGLGLALLAAACFEPPVTEEMELTFLADGRLHVRGRTHLAGPEEAGHNRALERRLDELREAAPRGEDALGRRLAALGPDRQLSVLERRAGALIAFGHEAVVADPQAVRELFADAPLAVVWQAAGTERRLEFTPLDGSRATADQERRARHAVRQFAARVFEYAEAIDDLYAYLDTAPDRGQACFQALLGAEFEAGGEELSEEEEELVGVVSGVLESLVEVLAVPPGDAWTPDELARLVFDPFPTALTVVVEGTVLETEGFVAAGMGRYQVPGRSLWEALARLEGRWLSPDPAIAWVAEQQSAADAGEEGEDEREEELARRLAALPRSTRRPLSTNEVLQALEQELRPAPVYRLVWDAGGTIPAE